MITILNNTPEQYLAYIDNFLTIEEITHYIHMADEQSNYDTAGVRQPDGTYKIVPDYRQNKRGNIVSELLASEMFEKSKEYIPEKIREFSLIRLDSNFKFYKYEKGDFFNWHKDGSIKFNTEKSLVTWMLYLTTSGMTQFENYEDVKAVAGRLVIFNHKITHKSPPLESEDLKIVMRTDIMYKPIWG